MHVTRVELDNIKAYERGSFDFRRGTTAIVGPNGAGKTTILEAIAWALFDTLDYSKDDFLRRGAKKGSVRVTFESGSDGRQYIVYRDTGNGYYVHDPGLGVKVAEKKQDVSALLRQLLGIEPGTDVPTLFKSAIGVPQGTLTADFLKPASQRKASFDRLLKVEEYREGADKLLRVERLIGERTADVRERIGQAQGQLATYERLVAELEETARRAAELETSVESLRRETEERTRAVAALDSAERRVSEGRARAERTAVERGAAVRRWRELQTELEAARRAGERQQATAVDYAAHVAALELLVALEHERRERDRLGAHALEAERMAGAAERDVRRFEEALERAARARAALVELEPEVNAQEELERERERLRDLLAQARASRERLVRLDRELDELRAQHAQARERIKSAESAEGAQLEVERLESERIGVETELSKVEQKLAERKVLERQRGEQAREADRLRRSVEKLERETREFEARAAGAERAAALEARERELAASAASLRAQIAHDERVREQVKGGVCPVLASRCTSFTEGRDFEFYFGDTIETNRAALRQIELEAAGAAREVAGARAALMAAAQVSRERERVSRERAQLTEQDSRLAATENHLAELAGATDELRETLANKMIGVDATLSDKREAARRYAELGPLRARLAEIVEEGKRRREERDELSAAANAADALEGELKENDAALRRLRDPRGRAAALRDEAAREASLTIELSGARDALAGLAAQKREHDAALARFGDLETRWSRSVAERERTAAAFREHIESKSLADLLPAREESASAAEETLRRATAEAEAASAEYERAAAAYDPARHADERARLAVLGALSADAAARLEVARDAREKLAAEIARLDEVSAGLQTELREQKRLGRLHETTEFMRDTLKKAGPEVTKSYVAHISVEANQLFREITGEAGQTLRWTSDYEIVVEEGGHERPFVSLSGGEQMAAALAVRLALLKQLSDIRVAFFDEPTVNMDAERRERLALQIGQVRHFDQLFVISHDDTFEEAVDHVVTLAARREQAATA